MDLVCQLCWNHFSNKQSLWKHKAHTCLVSRKYIMPNDSKESKLSLSHRKDNITLFGFTLDNDWFTCHIGCTNWATREHREMAKHLLEAHSRDELEIWQIPVAKINKVKRSLDGNMDFVCEHCFSCYNCKGAKTKHLGCCPVLLGDAHVPGK
jgi:hypothetical protein